MTDLSERELQVAQELAFAVLRTAFHDLAIHLTFDESMSPGALAAIERRLEDGLARAVAARREEVHARVQTHGKALVHQVLTDAHRKVLREHSGRMAEGT